MESKMVDVMIHIDLDIGHENREKLRDLILNHEGVDAAAYHEDKPHLMIVEYDPDQVTSQQLLDIVKRQGVNAELVGL